MKRKTTIAFGLLAIFMVLASLVAPAGLGSPKPASADPGILRWNIVDTPGSYFTRNDILFTSEINTLAVGPNGTTILATVTRTTVPAIQLLATGDGGISWGGSGRLLQAMIQQWGAAQNVWEAAIAPDDNGFWAVTTTDATGIGGPREVWVTEDAGRSWGLTRLAPLLVPGETIRAIDISVNYRGRHDIAVATVGPFPGGNIYVINSNGFGGWLAQGMAALVGAADYFAVRFSPSYAGDSGLAFVCANPLGTWYNIALRDIDANTTPSLAFPAPGIEVRDATWAPGNEPNWGTLNKADLELPSDFSATATSLRRAYISLDAHTGAVKGAGNWDGIFRIDDNNAYTLMDTHNTPNKSIYSIGYFGTYASGKLLAGERMGFPCTATVPTWFTDSPTTCPIPCWYPALKPTTGAAAQPICAPGSQTGTGAALVNWGGYGRLNGTLGYAATGSNAIVTAALWFIPWLLAPTPDDESAFALSRNNGETWNQLSLIDTTIDWLNDVAAAPDCSTVYIASSNNGAPIGCASFDSVFRSSSNPEVAAPLPAFPAGTYWERVFTHTTSLDCTTMQTDAPILRLSPYCDDLPDGQLIAWAARGTRAQAWSPDFGDYWAMITPRWPIQDFAFESSKVMYNLEAVAPAFAGGPIVGGPRVQKLPFTGTAWSTLLADVDSSMTESHTIVAYPEGKVFVGAGATTNLALAAAISTNFATDTPSFDALWMLQAGATNDRGNVHTAFDTNFKNNSLLYIADEAPTVPSPAFPKLTATPTTGSVYRNKAPGATRWVEMDMMEATNGAVGTFNQSPGFLKVGFFGIVNAFTGANGQQALYVASDNVAVAGSVSPSNSVVFRTLWPQDGMPKPGIIWDALMVYVPTTATNVNFTLEPSSLKECGSCTLDTNTTLYAIDDEVGGQFLGIGSPPPTGAPGYNPIVFRQGMLWTYTDCLAKKGPALVTKDKALIGCDPVSGRAQEVNLCWEQLCVATGYDVEIGKDTDFNIKVIDWVPIDNAALPGAALVPANRLEPCAYIPAGGTLTLSPSDLAVTLSGVLECGHTYYWRVMARVSATTEVIRSPWSEARSFTIKAGLPVTTPYYGPQLLAPNNGCLGCPAKPASFSWSPFKGTTKYTFVLAKDAAMTQVVKKAEVTTTAYEYDGTLDYSTNYFWRVMALAPAPSDWSATFSFQTAVAPPPPPAPEAPPTRLQDWLALPAKAIVKWIATINFQLIPVAPVLPWGWAIIAVSVVLFILWLVVMIAISKRVRKSRK